jgi:hypothetical protein
MNAILVEKSSKSLSLEEARGLLAALPNVRVAGTKAVVSRDAAKRIIEENTSWTIVVQKRLRKDDLLLDTK